MNYIGSNLQSTQNKGIKFREPTMKTYNELFVKKVYQKKNLQKKKKIAFMEKQSRFLDEYIFANKPGKPFMR